MAFFRRNSQLPKTGQTTEYTPAGYTCKDDGGNSAGLSTSFTKLTTGQFAGTTNVTVNGKTEVKSNNVMYEKHFGLFYTVAHSASVGPLSDGALYWYDATNHEDIFEYCDQANLAGLAGFTDWRPANELEMVLITKLEAPAGSFATGFDSPTLSQLWMSNTRPNLTTNALTITVSSGGIGTGQSKTANTNGIFLVRGGL